MKRLILAAIAALFLCAPASAKVTKVCHKTPDAPYELNEVQCKYSDGVWVISGRTALPWTKKLNLVWWFGNDFEPVAPSWYLPNDPNRLVKWYLRNPLQNAGNYVFGTKDLNYTIRFVKGPPGVTNYADQNQTGCLWTILDNSRGGNLWFPRVYVSCTDKYVTWYAGTQWSGFFGLKFNIQHSKVQFF